MARSLDDILGTIKSLEPLPEVALKVLELSRREDAIPREVAAVVQTDAAITAKVLKLANSAYYGFQREIASLEEAANLLGTRTLTSLVLTSCTGQYFRDLGGSTSRSREVLWLRSVSNALAAGLLARLLGRADHHRAYTAGLLQDIGQLVLDRFLVAERLSVLAEVERGVPLLEAELAVLGMHHAEAGARLAERWSLPESLCDTIRHHHDPENARIDPELASIVQLGEQVASALELEEGQDGVVGVLSQVSPWLETLREISLGEVSELLVAELQRAKDLVAG